MYKQADVWPDGRYDMRAMRSSQIIKDYAL